MSRLDDFLSLLCGRFDNARQLEELKQAGGPALPLAEHVNTVCNDRIAGLPADFPGNLSWRRAITPRMARPTRLPTCSSLPRRGKR